MKFETNGTFWIVENPSQVSELGDICWETSLAGLELQFRGGWTTENRPVLYTDRGEAEKDARARLAVRDCIAEEQTWECALPSRVAANKGETK